MRYSCISHLLANMATFYTGTEFTFLGFHVKAAKLKKCCSFHETSVILEKQTKEGMQDGMHRWQY